MSQAINGITEFKDALSGIGSGQRQFFQCFVRVALEINPTHIQ
jgi:hypothetical protein